MSRQRAPDDWGDREGAELRLRTALVGMIARARYRLVLILVLTVSLVALVAVKRERATLVHRGELILRITEGDIVRFQDPLMPPRLADYMEDAAKSREVLGHVITELGLYPDQRGPELQDAVEELAEAITIDVYGNYFADFRGASRAPKSAAVVFTFEDADPTVVMPVLHAIVDRLRLDDAMLRSRVSHDDALATDVALQDLERRFRQRQDEASRAALLIDRALLIGLDEQAAHARVVYEGLQELTRLSEIHLDKFRIKYDIVHTRRAVDVNAMAIDYDVVDTNPPEPVHPIPVALFAGIVFVVAFPLVGMFVAVFDNRVYIADDVHRLELACLATIPPHHGRRRRFS